MGTKATNINQAADGKSKILSGKGAKYQEAGSVGGNVTLSNSSKGIDLTGSKTQGNITIGETGLGETFASTIKELFSSQQSNTSDLLGLLTRPAAITATAAGPETTEPQQPSPLKKWLLPAIGVLLLGALIWVFSRRN